MQELEKKIYQSEKLGDHVDYYQISDSKQVIVLMSKSESEPEIESVQIFQDVKEFREWANNLEEI